MRYAKKRAGRARHEADALFTITKKIRIEFSNNHCLQPTNLRKESRRIHIPSDSPDLSYLACLVLIILLMFPCISNAGGTGYAGAGAKGLGRAGAFAVKADDTSALLYNPANLVAIPGVQLGGGIHIAFSRSCFNRFGTYGDSALHEGAKLELTTPGYESVYGSGTNGSIMKTEFPNVCNSGPPQLVPDLGVTWRLHPKVGLGVGIVAPPGVATLAFGETDSETGKRGVIEVPGGGLPAPTRYMLLDMAQLAFFPSIAIGYSPLPILRFGVTAGWGIVSVKQNILAKPLQGEWFSTDSLSQLEAKDTFLPRVTVSLFVEPIDNFLETMLYFTWQDDIDAKGSITYTTGYYADTEEGYIDQTKATDVHMKLPQPWQAGLGVRVVIPRNVDESTLEARKAKKRPTDGMLIETADIELDAVYEINSRVDSAIITQESVYAQPFVEPGEMELPQRTIQHFVWKDQLSLRLGGDVNVAPDRLALRWGFHYETHGVVEGWEQLNFMPFQRIGVHAGATLRVWRMDINLGYGFIYQFPVTLRERQAKQTQVVASAERGTGTIVNQGKFTSRYHVIGMGLTFRIL
jgi:long-subunit fatty acid transport protein